MKINYISLLPVFILSSVGIVNAQKDTTRLKQEVEVTKAYQPSISDAFKINDIPQIKEEKTDKPVFEYSISSEPVFSTFSVKPVQAATMVGEPKTELGKGLLKLGIGNYLTPYGELFYNAIPGNKSNFGMHFKHLSSHGKIKLVNDDKVDAPFSDNAAEIFGKRFYRNSTLTVTGFFDRKGLQYYGYTGDKLTDAEKEAIIPTWQDKQVFSKGGVDFCLKSNTGASASSDMKYDLGFNFQYFGAKTGQRENLGKMQVSLNKNLDQFEGLLESSLTFYYADKIANRVTPASNQKKQILLMVNPAIVFTGDNALLQIGAKTYTMIDDDEDARIVVTPNVKAEWSPVENILTLYAHAGGDFGHNVYSKIAAENPFAAPDHDIRNTEYQYILSGGIRGKFSSKTNYRAGVSYSGIKDMHFYYAQGFDYYSEESSFRNLQNTLDVVYDDLKLLKLTGEFFHAASENLSFHLEGNYYSYEMETLAQPWHMPEFDVDLSLIYKTDGPLCFTLDAYVIGKRQALFVDSWSSMILPGFTETIYPMDPVFDLNASVEYQYNRKLGFFLQLNNFAFQHYETWSGYANQGFNVLAGVNFSF
ncbi:MAG: hypothetical protein A2W90_06085 [Bacteroidetes bacterium GWF2_42_66]|nr:MAG: hypothetical protein A2W92_01465 [Bacteroidetes bacterium GWA2_42_15]OFY03610.1 MAG: hypothetical protein A2W89_18810 [Bacteroidetes bacterium GWE2_42_39]OFY45975.1 MAG: hypothetical protein A2W90_06085 [Bacteroidetes bacterium GWF2_42_66]HBL75220.1 hypothetical protein [Prolixibacteraceae bacterium]HCR91756.1 hypothetical protein [Prolixibacteraceae bacterium]